MNRNVLPALLSLMVACSTFASTPSPSAKADPAKGKQLAEKVCAACHGLDGNSSSAINPSLASQHPEYLYAQLLAFKKGARKNPIMAGQVAALQDEDLKNVSAYYATQAAKPRGASDKNLMATGKKVYQGGNAATGVPACMACHSPNGSGMPAQYPRLAGQHAAYTTAQLAAFKAGDLRKNQVMQGIAAKMSDQEMKSVADFIAGLR